MNGKANTGYKFVALTMDLYTKRDKLSEERYHRFLSHFVIPSNSVAHLPETQVDQGKSTNTIIRKKSRYKISFGCSPNTVFLQIQIIN